MQVFSPNKIEVCLERPVGGNRGAQEKQNDPQDIPLPVSEVPLEDFVDDRAHNRILISCGIYVRWARIRARQRWRCPDWALFSRCVRA